MVTQVPGGRMAELLSAKWVMLAAVLVNAVCTLLTPPAAALHAGALLAMRIGEGLGAVSSITVAILFQWFQGFQLQPDIDNALNYLLSSFSGPHFPSHARHDFQVGSPKRAQRPLIDNLRR